MPEIIDHVNYLSCEIGARPAGTEEEQSAALYITEIFQKNADLPAMIEDFEAVSDLDVITIICCACALIVTILGWCLPSLGILWFLLLLLCAVVYATEAFDKSLVSRLLKRGMSQNVVAKYTPGSQSQQKGVRSRKVVLVSRYDSGKNMPELSIPLVSYLPYVQWASFVSIVLLPILMLLRDIVAAPAGGVGLVIFTVLTAIAFVCVAIPMAVGVMHKLSRYNDGANCNAAGAAVLLDVATRVGRGRVSESELAERENARMHGEEAARTAGLVPDGVSFEYEVTGVKAPDLQASTPEARLAAAKAAVAALTGKPIEGVAAADISQHLVQIKEPPLKKPQGEEIHEEREETLKAFGARLSSAVQKIVPSADDNDPLHVGQDAEKDIVPIYLDENRQDEVQGIIADNDGRASGEANLDNTPLSEVAEEEVAESTNEQFSTVTSDASALMDEAANNESSVPTWYKTAQAKAKKSPDQPQPTQRSKYASALDAAVQQSAEHFVAANNALNDSFEQHFPPASDICEIKAPQWNGVEEGKADHQNTDAYGGEALLSEDAAHTESFKDEAQQAAEAKSETASGVILTSEEGSRGGDILTKQSNQADAQASDSLNVAAAAQVLQQAPSGAEAANGPSEARANNNVQHTSAPHIPSFLDPRNAVAEVRGKRDLSGRTEKRVDVTSASIDNTGRIELGSLPQKKAPSAQEVAQRTRALEPITLPDVEALPSVSAVEVKQQRAPLAQVGTEEGKAAAKGLLNMLPSINLNTASSEAANTAERPVASFAGVAETLETESAQPAPDAAALRTTLPSLSGTISRQGELDTQNSAVSAAGSFVSAGATGAFAPVGDELIENVSPEDMYIEDADDSEYEENFTEMGAFAGPGYVEMPRSRFVRLFDRLRRKDKHQEAEQSANEWLDVDEEFDARTVGMKRGNWESFREDESSHEVSTLPDSTIAFDPVSEEEQVAESDLGQTTALPVFDVFEDKSEYSQDDDYDEIPNYEVRIDQLENNSYNEAGFAEVNYNQAATVVPYETDEGLYEDDWDEGEDGSDDTSTRGRYWNGGAFSTRRLETSDLDSQALAEEAAHAAQPTAEVSEELQQIYQFRNPDINTEVWFVALGSEIAQHSGMAAFLDKHKDELRGAIIIDLDALGAGDLTLIEQEGQLRTVKTSSRMNRYLKKAQQATGLSYQTASIKWGDSSASYAIKRGCQAMHLVGMDGPKPAYLGEERDTIEQIDPELLEARSEFVMELLKNI